MHKIYSLSDPRDGHARYVGQTVQTLQRRLNKHLSTARHERGSWRLLQWLRSLLADGVDPEITLLEETDDVGRETFWIDRLRAEGFDLVNACPGGERGSLGYEHTAEARAKMRAAATGRVISAESRRKMSAAHTGKRRSPQHRANVAKAKAGHAVTAATKAKIRAGVKAYWARKRLENA